MLSTVIALNPRNRGRKWPLAPYRRRMKRPENRAGKLKAPSPETNEDSARTFVLVAKPFNAVNASSAFSPTVC
jgi:hypothetical protein